MSIFFASIILFQLVGPDWCQCQSWLAHLDKLVVGNQAGKISEKEMCPHVSIMIEGRNCGSIGAYIFSLNLHLLLHCFSYCQISYILRPQTHINTKIWVVYAVRELTTLGGTLSELQEPGLVKNEAMEQLNKFTSN